MNNPLVSIYIPTRDRPALLKRAVDSVLEQTYQSIELIVVDDGSTDDTRDYLSQLHNEGALQAIFLSVSMGPCVARNLAISASKGGFVTGLDDDDFFLPERIERFVSKWQEQEGDAHGSPVAGLFDDLIFYKPGGQKIRHSFPAVLTYQDLLEKNDIGNQIFAPRKYFLEAGLFDPCMPMWQDWDLWRRMSQLRGNFLCLGIGTYVVDQAHGHQRITSKPEFAIRYAMAALDHKSGASSQRSKSSLLISCLHYPQVKLTLKDILLLAKAGRFVDLIKFLSKWFRFG